MAADMHIHVRTEDVTDDVLREFFGNTIGSKWERDWSRAYDPTEHDRWRAAYTLIGHTPSVHVGEVSWLKAALSGDQDAYIPDAIGQIADIIGEDMPIVDDDLIARISGALKSENATGYDINDEHEIIAFLREHIGKPVFTVSW